MNSVSIYVVIEKSLILFYREWKMGNTVDFNNDSFHFLLSNCVKNLTSSKWRNSKAKIKYYPEGWKIYKNFKESLSLFKYYTLFLKKILVTNYDETFKVTVTKKEQSYILPDCMFSMFTCRFLHTSFSVILHHFRLIGLYNSPWTGELSLLRWQSSILVYSIVFVRNKYYFYSEFLICTVAWNETILFNCVLFALSCFCFRLTTHYRLFNRPII